MVVALIGAMQASATSFAILLGDLAGAEKQVRELQIDDLTIDIREMTTGLDVEYRVAQNQGWRVYAPGAVRLGDVHITLNADPDSEWSKWREEAARGKNIRKNITILLMKEGKPTGRTYNLLECYPARWTDAQTIESGAVVETQTIEVKCGRIELKSRLGSPDTSTGPVVFSSPDGALVESFDSWSGGEPNLVLSPLFNGDRNHIGSPGHKTVNEIILRGSAHAERKNLCQWINSTYSNTAAGVVPGGSVLQSALGRAGKGRTYVYHDCFPVRYVFPRLSATNTTGNVMEEVHIKPIRMDISN